jgi:hypothetical protein
VQSLQIPQNLQSWSGRREAKENPYALHAGPPVLPCRHRIVSSLFALVSEPPVIDLLALAVRLCYTSRRLLQLSRLRLLGFAPFDLVRRRCRCADTRCGTKRFVASCLRSLAQMSMTDLLRQVDYVD